ncbi:hypothetical protein [Mycolicibacterium peregrinum]|uniref:Uncharacterized protein n=1 Tax=Mycolicibacterium peregrinum TaxID=43304 RepID=A0A4Z0HKE3_MYCPR|nr:hypothetical protein [Mycolicibacterium peregrinum]TGB37857.1 hypothetical protein EJD98_25235 [Mycolicibacterium peregrinum]TGB38124.1 hypothetical protein EJD94_25330 [Mycolicibacterium peregrinum]
MGAVIAAWAAAVMAGIVALAQTRENRQHLRREAIAELDVRSTELGIAAGTLLGGIMRFLRATDGDRKEELKQQINGQLLARLTGAATDLNRALRVAEMVCPHKQVHDEIDAMQKTMRELLDLATPDQPFAQEEERNAFLQRALDGAEEVLLRLADHSAAAVYVGMKRYSVRPRVVPKRLLAREIEITGRTSQPDSPNLGGPAERLTTDR